MEFKNRSEAGKILADRLRRDLRPEDIGDCTVIIALPRGGVPVAQEAASELSLPMDVLVVRKIGAPGNPEFGIGAITESGYFWINPQAVASLGEEGFEADQMERTITRELDRVRRGADLFRGGRPLPELRGKTVILIDDGIATGGTSVVASRYLRSQGASRIIIAAPICTQDAIALLNQEADQVVCVKAPKIFYAVGDWYEDFSQVSDEEVAHALSHQTQEGDLFIPDRREGPKGLVIFAHGSGSSRFSPRNRKVARDLNEAGFATFLFDLLTAEEEANRANVFDIPFLAGRLVHATRSIQRRLSERGLEALPIGYFGASTGAAAAIWAAADLEDQIAALVSRGGRPDLAGSRLTEVRAPTLLIVGSLDHPVIGMNERAHIRLPNADLKIVEGATHLFEEPGTLDQVSRLAVEWFDRHLSKSKRQQNTAA